MRIQFSCLALAVLILVPASVAGGGPPALSGKIVEVSEQGNYPLDQAEVELLVPGTDVIKHSTFTDDHGAYAFRGVAPGAYEIVVKSGKQIFTQVIKDGEDKPRREIRVPAKPARLDISVLTDASS